MEKDVVAVTLQICIYEGPGSNLSHVPTYSKDFCGFSQSSKEQPTTPP
jgi:hypothetical protein